MNTASQDAPRTHLILRLVLALCCTQAMAYGLVALFAPERMGQVSSMLSQAVGTVSPELAYLFKPLGLYICMFALALGFAAYDPTKYRPFCWWGGSLLIARGVQRWVLTDELFALFQIPPARNYAHVLYLFFCGGVILGLTWRLSSREVTQEKGLESEVGS